MGSRKHPSVYLHQAAVSLSLSSALTTVYIIQYYSSLYPHCVLHQESTDNMGSQWINDETDRLLDFVKAKHEAKIMVLAPHFVTHKISDFRGAQTVVRSRTDEQCCAKWERLCRTYFAIKKWTQYPGAGWDAELGILIRSAEDQQRLHTFMTENQLFTLRSFSNRKWPFWQRMLDLESLNDTASVTLSSATISSTAYDSATPSISAITSSSQASSSAASGFPINKDDQTMAKQTFAHATQDGIGSLSRATHQVSGQLEGVFDSFGDDSFTSIPPSVPASFCDNFMDFGNSTDRNFGPFPGCGTTSVDRCDSFSDWNSEHPPDSSYSGSAGAAALPFPPGPSSLPIRSEKSSRHSRSSPYPPTTPAPLAENDPEPGVTPMIAVTALNNVVTRLCDVVESLPSSGLGSTSAEAAALNAVIDGVSEEGNGLSLEEKANIAVIFSGVTDDRCPNAPQRGAAVYQRLGKQKDLQQAFLRAIAKKAGRDRP